MYLNIALENHPQYERNRDLLFFFFLFLLSSVVSFLYLLITPSFLQVILSLALFPLPTKPVLKQTDFLFVDSLAQQVQRTRIDEAGCHLHGGLALMRVMDLREGGHRAGDQRRGLQWHAQQRRVHGSGVQIATRAHRQGHVGILRGVQVRRKVRGERVRGGGRDGVGTICGGHDLRVHRCSRGPGFESWLVQGQHRAAVVAGLAGGHWRAAERGTLGSRSGNSSRRHGRWVLDARAVAGNRHNALVKHTGNLDPAGRGGCCVAKYRSTGKGRR
mmetsp:Transcript_10589/g.18480  ORF Transcript_10589/g.18480 Transcript_10589/m.18480 type:complete len:273 (+) Transcript_10589:91-909(+)